MSVKRTVAATRSLPSAGARAGDDLLDLVEQLAPVSDRRARHILMDGINPFELVTPQKPRWPRNRLVTEVRSVKMRGSDTDCTVPTSTSTQHPPLS